MIDKNMESEIVEAYHGVRLLLKKVFRNYNVITQSFKSYSDIQQAINDFKRLGRNIRDKDGFIYKKIVATIYYLTYLSGRYITYDRYVKNTIGVDVFFTAQKQIDELISLLKSNLKKLNIKYSKEEIKNKFYTMNMNEQELKKYLEDKLFLYIKESEEYLNLKFDSSIKIKFVPNDMPYRYRLSIGKDEYTFNVNTELVNKYLNETSLEYAIAHEVCGHAFQLNCWRREISKGNISEVYGCEEDYGPEIFQLEGVGESIFYFVFRDKIDTKMKIELLLDNIHHLVQNNSYILFNSGKNIKEVTDYYCSKYILADREDARERVKLTKEDAFFRANLYVYGSCLTIFKNISNKLSGDDRRKFFRKMYINPMTYEEILDFYERLSNKKDSNF